MQLRAMRIRKGRQQKELAKAIGTDEPKDAYIELMTELNEELAAHFVERELGNSAALKRIISDKPSFNKRKTGYFSDARCSSSEPYVQNGTEDKTCY